MMMRLFSPALLLASGVAAKSLSSGSRNTSPVPTNPLTTRQFDICVPVSTPSCAESCGKGNIICQEWPHCYNPDAGESCCSDGTYCEEGYYCVSGGCCRDGETCSGSGFDFDIDLDDLTSQAPDSFDTSTSDESSFTSPVDTSSPSSPTPTETETESETETRRNPFSPTQTVPSGFGDDDDDDSDSGDDADEARPPVVTQTGAADTINGNVALSFGGLGLGALFMML
jgi:hypothetical protein